MRVRVIKHHETASCVVIILDGFVLRKIVLVVVVLGIVYLGFCSYAASSMMKVPRLPVEGSPSDVGLDYEDVSFASRGDGVDLRGWFVPGNDSCIIIINGGHQNRNDAVVGTLELTRDLSRQGYSILLFDLRGRGESEGEARAFINTDSDIGGAVDHMRYRGCSRVYIIGFSAGGAALTLLTGGIDGMILDTCFTDVRDMFVKAVVHNGYPEFFARVILPGTFYMANELYGYQGENPVDKVGDINCPILFIHGEEDKDVLPINCLELYTVRDNLQDELWIVSGAGHTLSYRVKPLEYVSKITRFLEENYK